MDFPVLKTERLILNRLSEADVDDIFELFSDHEVVAYYDLEALCSPSQAKDLIDLFEKRFQAGEGIRWAIRLVAEDQLDDKGALIGTCGFNSWSKPMKSAVIGYDLKKSYWGRGYATEAISKITQYAFSGEMPCGGIHRIQADTVLDNLASESVLKKVGFVEEGLRRDSGYWKGRFHDLKCFGLINPN